MIFTAGRYFSPDNYEMVVLERVEKMKNGAVLPRVYAYSGFANPAYYRIRVNGRKNETVTIQGHVFEA